VYLASESKRSLRPVRSPTHDLSLLLTPSALSTLNLCSGRSTMASMMAMIPEGLLLAFRTRHSLVLENLALRHQIVVLQRSSKRPRLKMRDRVFWVLLSRIWSGWRDSLSFVKPETVIRWHRKGFRLYWTWRSRRTGQGRPGVSLQVRELIRKMSRANPFYVKRADMLREADVVPLRLETRRGSTAQAKSFFT